MNASREHESAQPPRGPATRSQSTRTSPSGRVPIYRAEQVGTSLAELGESPLWDDRHGCLRWLDIPSQRMLSRDREGRETLVDLSRKVTCVEPYSDRYLASVTETGFGLLDPQTGHVMAPVAALNDETLTMNDGAIDPLGRFWAGSATHDGTSRGCLYSFDGHQVTPHVDGIAMSNGIGWSPSGSEMYHVDSTAGTITAWTFDAERGRLGSSRQLRRFQPSEELPDGLTVDASGGIWLAIWGSGQVLRLDPTTGATTAIVEVPTPCATSCAFGDADLSTLYITTANYESPPGGGRLYSARIRATGLHSRAFKSR